MTTIRYRRPETPWSLSRSTTPDAARAVLQIARLVALGYEVVDVTPPLVAPQPVAEEMPGEG